MARVMSDRERLVQSLMHENRMGDLGAWLTRRREAGVSWAEMSYELREALDVNVSYEALRRWHAARTLEATGEADRR